MREMKDGGVQWIGEIPEKWAIVSTKFLFTIISGATPESAKSENWDGNIRWITPADYKTKDVYVAVGRRNLTQMGFDSCSTNMVPTGSIIFSKRAPIGSVAINSADLCTNQGCLSCINKGTSFVKFYYYVMSIATEQYELLGSGTTFKEISAQSFSNFMLPVPSYEDQLAISEYLDMKCAQIDTLIANVQSQIEKLKAYKQSMITEVVTKGLDHTVPMKESGIEWIGQIPEHWDMTRKLAFVTTDGISYGIVKLYDPDDVNGVKVLRCSDVFVGFILPVIAKLTQFNKVDLPMPLAPIRHDTGLEKSITTDCSQYREKFVSSNFIILGK